MVFSTIKNPFSYLVLMLISISSFSVYAQEKPVQLFAHGSRAHAQDENTLEAFKNTNKQGLRGFETSIRLSKDGELVLFHDASLERTTVQKGNIEEMTAAELRKIKTKKPDNFTYLFISFDKRPL